MVQLTELRDVLAACSEENGMKFSDEQLDQLTIALYEDADNCELDEDVIEDENRVELGISFEKMKAQMAKQPGLLKNLSTRYFINENLVLILCFNMMACSLDRFLVPTVPTSVTKKSSFTLPTTFSRYNLAYFQNNYTLVIFLAAFLAVHLVLFITRAIQFSDNNWLYIIARAAGM